MIYFKTINITNCNNDTIERILRRKSVKRHTLFGLDIKSSSTYVKDENRSFIGIETNKNIKVTRIRTPFEWFLPKLILRFDKNNFTKYRIRYSLFSFIIAVFLALIIVLNIFYSLKYKNLESNFINIIILTAIFLALSFVEIKICKRYVNSIINKNNYPIN